MWVNLDKDQVQVLNNLLGFINNLDADYMNTLIDIKAKIKEELDPVIERLNQLYEYIPQYNRCNTIDEAFRWLYKETTGHEAMGPVCYAAWNLKNVLKHCECTQVQIKLDEFIKWYEQEIAP